MTKVYEAYNEWYGAFLDYSVTTGNESVSISFNGGWYNSTSIGGANNVNAILGYNDGSDYWLSNKHNLSAPTASGAEKYFHEWQSVSFPRRTSSYTVTLYSYWGFVSSGSGTQEVQASKAITIPALVAPTAPTNCTNTRNDDNKNTVSWTNGSNITGTVIERKVNSDTWSVLATVGSSATSYADTSTSTDNAYQYRVKHTGYGGQSTSYATSGTTYNTPAAPSSISGARVSGTIAGITLTNTSNTATSTELQYSSDKSTWSDATTANERATYIEWNTGGGQFYFRARNARGSLKSGWTDASNLVVTIAPPNAPTLLLPSSGGTVAKTQENVTFSWQHNPVDGSAQTAAELQYSTNGGYTWTTVSATTAQSVSVSNAFTVNSTVTWRVRTKGADASYGSWSGTRTFTVSQVPTVSFVTGKPSASVTDMPIEYQLSYSDQSGVFASGIISVLDSNGNAIYTEQVDSTLAGYISSSEFLPENGATYTLSATLQSTTSLSAIATASFNVQFLEPSAGSLTISNQDNGYVGLVVSYASGGGRVTQTGTTTGVQFLNVEEDYFFESIKVEGTCVRWCQLLRYDFMSGTGNTVTLVVGRKYWYDDGLIHVDEQPVISGDGSTRTADTNNRLYDLTFIFGSGNEPASERAFKNSDAYKKMNGSSSYCINSVFTSVGDAGGSIGSLVWDGLNIVQRNSNYNYKYCYNIIPTSTYLAGIGNVHDTAYITDNGNSVTIDRRIGVRAYQSSDLTNPNVITDGRFVTYYVLETPTTETYTGQDIPDVYYPYNRISMNTSPYSNVEITLGNGVASVDHASIRRNGVTIADNLQSGTAVTDKYAPLNSDYAYEVVTHAQSGAVKAAEFSNRINSPYWFFYWGANEIAKAKWNPNGTTSLSRPQRVRRRYDGKMFEQSYDSIGVSDVRNLNAVLLDDEHRVQFEKLMYESGHGVYKSGEGDVYEADIEYTRNMAFYQKINSGEISLTITRTEGVAL